MNDLQTGKGIEPGTLRRSWRIITWAGFLGSVYYLLCISGAPRIKFLTELGATPFDFGLISSLGAVVLTFQVLGSIVGNRTQHRKPLWIAIALVHRFVFLGVLLAPLLPIGPRGRIGWILLVLFCHDALAQTSVPIWFSWMTDLVPRESLTRHWATRQRFITAATILVMVLIAFGFHFFEQTGRIIAGFTILACIGMVLGVIDILLFRLVPEPPHERIERPQWKETMTQPLRDATFRPFLVFMGYWQFAVFAAAPFFGLYMLEYLQLSVLTVQLLATMGALGVVASSRFWGLLCDCYGYRPVLKVLVLCKALTPLAFILAPREPAVTISFLTVVWFLDGLLNGGIMLAMQGPLLKSTPRRNRTMYIAASNFFAIGVMASVAPIIAGYIIRIFNSQVVHGTALLDVSGYHVAFALSFVLRLGAIGLASRIVEPAAAPARAMLRQIGSWEFLRASRFIYRLHEASDDAKRFEAIRVLGMLRHPVAIGELIYALQDTSQTVRNAAAEALGKIGAAEAVAPLTDALFDGASGIQSPAARALGRIRSVEALRALLRNLRKDAAALVETIDALAETGNDAAIVPLISLFNDVEEPQLRTRIAAALAKLNSMDSTEEVLDLLHARRPPSQQIIK